MWSLLQLTVHRATRPSFHLLLVHDITADSGQFRNQVYWSVRTDGQT